MLKATIQKENATVCLYPIKIENQILNFLIWNFLISAFLKKKNSITSLMTDIGECLLSMYEEGLEDFTNF